MATSGTLPPARPVYILRGHDAPVHALEFHLDNAFLVSGDSEGWVIAWRTSSKRPAACWRAHEAGILGIKRWGDSIVTHGRDHKLRVWQLHQACLEGELLDQRLPGERRPGAQSQGEPWLLHSMAVSALNFCAFSLNALEAQDRQAGHGDAFFAVPNALDSGGIDFFHLPSEHRVSVLKSDPAVKTGMVMALDLSSDAEGKSWTVISGYEDGHTMVHRWDTRTNNVDATWKWQKVFQNRSHAQPVLSLDTAPSLGIYFTSSADAVIAKFKVPDLGDEVQGKPSKLNNTKHAGQQDLTVRNDGKILATAGWDSKIRVYSTKTLTELAVLKWHQEGCSSIAFADISSPNTEAVARADGEVPSTAVTTSSGGSAIDLIRQNRSLKAQRSHLLACGAKDGKVSLWDIY